MSKTRTPARLIVAAALATVTSVAAHPGAGVAAAAPLNQPGAISTGITPPAATLYSSDWSAGLNGWAGSGAWKTLNGTLLNDGTASDDFITAPWVAGGHSNYAVEAEIRLIQDSQHWFGLFARRGEGNAAYGAALYSGGKAGIWHLLRSLSANSVAEGDSFTPGAGWHRYRLEVTGNVITFSVDGATLVTGIDNRYLAGGRVGLYSNSQQMEVRSFRVVAGTSGSPGVPTASALPPPTGLRVIAANPTAIKISWNDGSDNEAGFEINNGEISARVGPDVTSYTWTGLSPGSYMCVHVRAVNGASSSAWEPAAAPYYQCTTTSALPGHLSAAK